MKFNGYNIIPSRDRTKNYITYDRRDFKLLPLSSTMPNSKGGNSNVFILFDPSDTFDERIIKICKSPLESTWYKDNIRLSRFDREIQALQLAKGKNFIVKYFFDDVITISGRTFKYYVMEKGDSDLKEFVINNFLSLDDKVILSRQILNCIKELHELGIYHRDIKPDNYFFIGDTWKIGDLGLVRFREEDVSLDNPNEFIGPRGWVSPETMNKFLTYGKKTEFQYDCTIDDKSDVFQLANLLWFVFQCNVPIGKIRHDDFHLKQDAFYGVLMWMLNHSKDKRPDIISVEKELTIIFSKMAA